MGLNPQGGQTFVSVYIDDILVYSRMLEEHLTHLRLVLERIQKAGLKLKLAKCAFICKEVEYLGHILTPEGLKTNPRSVTSVMDFPTPTNVKEVRQFLGPMLILSTFHSPLCSTISASQHAHKEECNLLLV